MIDKLNDKPAATIGLLVDAISVGRSLDKREKGKERRSSEAERRKSPRQGCLEDTRGQETGRRNAIRRYANEIHSEALRRVCIPPFWTLCLRDLTRDDRESGGRGKRGEAEERSWRSWREKERKEEEKETKRRPHGDVMRLLMRILSLQADGLWGPEGFWNLWELPSFPLSVELKPSTPRI